MNEQHGTLDPPRRSWRYAIGGGIVLFLVSQIAIPSSYYVANEPTSERFSWRMFSSIDLSTWDTRLTEIIEENGQSIEREIPIQSMLQESHWKMVQRAQFDIVEPLMRQLVARDGVKEVRYLARGYAPSGAPMPPIQLTMKPGQPLQRIDH